MSLDDNRRIVLAVLEFLSQMRYDDLSDLLHEQLSWTVVGDPELFAGAIVNDKQQHLELLKGMGSLAAGGIQMTVTGTTAEGSRVAVEAVSSAVLANGAAYRNTYHFMFEIEDGMVLAVREYCDTLRALRSFSALMDS